jgi:hypothetical protein
MSNFKDKWRKFWGYTYLLNINTGEIHDTKNAKSRCHIEDISKKNKKYLTKKQSEKILGTTVNKKEVNGCRFCNPNKNTDDRFKK